MCRRTLGTAALAAMMGLTIVSPAGAGLIPAAVNVTQDGGQYRYSYNIQLPSDYRVKAGDFFTIYDFHGFAGGATVQPDGWSFSTALLGPNPPRVNPNDNPDVANLTWTFTGTDLNTAGSLGLFEALSNNGPGMTGGEFASQDHRDIDGRSVGNYTSVDVPAPFDPGTGGGGGGGGDPPGGGGGGDPPPDVPDAPEPATLLMLGIGLPLMGLTRLVHRRRRA